VHILFWATILQNQSSINQPSSARRSVCQGSEVISADQPLPK